MACTQATDPNPWMAPYTQWMNAWMNWYQAWMPRPGCGIPEIGCPPRCACTITWQAGQGEVHRATIEVRNTSAEPITYQLVTTQFQSCGKPIDMKPAVNPATITAAPGQTASATVEVPVGEQFQPGLTYTAEVLVRGKYERCVKLELQMRCGDEVCRFDHGDIPMRIRADEWWRHFQCTEPCFEPIARTVNPNG